MFDLAIRLVSLRSREEHLVALAKPEWDYLQRLLLLLESNDCVQTKMLPWSAFEDLLQESGRSPEPVIGKEIESMRRRRYTPEQIVVTLRDADVMLNAGKDEATKSSRMK